MSTEPAKDEAKETQLQRIRTTLSNASLPAWASWVDHALYQEDAELAQLRAENTRLRQALEFVRDYAWDTNPSELGKWGALQWHRYCEEVKRAYRDIASVALSPKPDGGTPCPP